VGEEKFERYRRKTQKSEEQEIFRKIRNPGQHRGTQMINDGEHFRR
jgi:hypothetical protein